MIADLSIEFTDTKSPNPFWLASAPSTDRAYNMVRAYQAGQGGVVWKTLGKDPMVVNVSSRYSAHFGPSRQVQGINNAGLIADHSLGINLREIAQVKKDWPDRALAVSPMVPCVEEPWKYILPLVEVTDADGIKLNFGCPHGMSERGMGAVAGQVPEYVEMVTRRCKTHRSLSVIVKLTPNIIDIRQSVRAAHRGGADAVLPINTINSVTSVNPEHMVALPVVDTQSTHGDYCDSAVKPTAPNMVTKIVRGLQTHGLPICGIGGVSNRRGAAEFVAFGRGVVQVCTAAMLHGFHIVEDMQDGFARWMDSHGYQRLSDFSGGVVGNITDWKYLDTNYQVITRIGQDVYIGCGRCHIACEDILHQAIASLPRVDGTHRYEVIDAECVSYNLRQITCPMENCIEMVPQDTGKPHLNWTQDPHNPYREAF